MSNPGRGLCRRWGGAVALVAALALVIPAHAVAGESYPVSAGSLVFGVTSGTHGYRIRFSEWERSDRRHFKVIADGHDATVTYAVPAGGAPADGVVANLGRRGRFDLRVMPVGKVHRLRLPRACEGRPGRWQDAYLVGTASFRGERGYTEAHVRRIPVVTESWPGFRCHDFEGGQLRGPSRRAQVFAQRLGVSFGAVLYPPHSTPADQRATFRASLNAVGGRVRISREVRVAAPEASFTFPGGPLLPEVVTVEPPQPFSGSASFTRSPESTFAWSGDLSVEFPGMDRIPLAGPGFAAGVCAIDDCVRQELERERPR
jgi:hypothetical protein